MQLSEIEIKPIENSIKREEMDDPTYFALDAVSNSKLGLINPDQGGSPQRFFTDKSKLKTNSLELGSSVHQLILEKDRYFLSDFEKPGGKIGDVVALAHKMYTREDSPLELDDAYTAAAKVCNYYVDSFTDKRLQTLKEKGESYFNFLLGKKQAQDKGEIILTEQQRTACLECVKSIKNNKAAVDLLYNQKNSFNEDVLLMDINGILKDILDEESVKIKLKGKLDNWSVDLDNNIITLNDLKTSGSPSQYFPGRVVKEYVTEREMFIPGSFTKYHYHRQLAMYSYMLLKYCNFQYGKRDWTINNNIIVVETQAPHYCQVFRVGEYWIKKGFDEFEDLLKRVIYHTIKGYDHIIELEDKAIFEI